MGTREKRLPLKPANGKAKEAEEEESAPTASRGDGGIDEVQLQRQERHIHQTGQALRQVWQEPGLAG